jgi:hypothetical protein
MPLTHPDALFQNLSSRLDDQNPGIRPPACIQPVDTLENFVAGIVGSVNEIPDERELVKVRLKERRFFGFTDDVDLLGGVRHVSKSTPRGNERLVSQEEFGMGVNTLTLLPTHHQAERRQAIPFPVA